MRSDCRHYDSRTYASGEVVRKCRLDLAPEAPWRCPDDCAGFELRRMDAGWQYGSLGKTAGVPEPEPRPEPGGEDIAALLDQAEEIVNTAAPEILAEMQDGEKKRRFARRKGKTGKGKNKKKKR